MKLYGTIADLTATGARQSFGILITLHDPLRVFPAGAVANNLPANTGDEGDAGVQSLGWEDHLEKKMATHFSILAWKIPWTEEPGRLQSVHRVTKNQTGLSD